MEKKINIGTILTYVLCAIAVGVAVFTVFHLLNKDNSQQEKNTNSFFGYNFFVVLSGSMENEFPAGSLIISKQVETATLQEGDIISFVSIDPNYMDEVVSHKIKSISEYNGELAFETFGTTTGTVDGYPALESKVLGKYQHTIPYIGHAIVFIQGENGFLVLIILPLAIIFISQVVRLVKTLKNSDDDEQDQEAELSKKHVAQRYKK